MKRKATSQDKALKKDGKYVNISGGKKNNQTSPAFSEDHILFYW